MKLTFTGTFASSLLLVADALNVYSEAITLILIVCVFVIDVVLFLTVNSIILSPSLVPTNVLLNEPIFTLSHWLDKSSFVPFLIKPSPLIIAYLNSYSVSEDAVSVISKFKFVEEVTKISLLCEAPENE